MKDVSVKIMKFIEQHALLVKGDRVLVGVSGGPDSLALLNFLYDKKNQLKIELAAMTVEHGLRGEASQADALYVKKWCQARDIACSVEHVDLAAYKATHQASTQIAARQARYQAFQEVMSTYEYDKLALAHHLDDQLETSLMAFINSSKSFALTGIPISRAFSDKMIIRPLLGLSKNDIEQYVRAHDLSPRIDASNEELNYLRNRVRHELIPHIKKENPNIFQTNHILRQSIAEDEAYIMKQAVDLLDRVLIKSTAMEVELDMTRLYNQPSSLLRRLFRLMIDKYQAPLRKAISYKHEQAFLDMIHFPGNKSLQLPENYILESVYHYLHFYRQTKDIKSSYFFEIKDMPFSVSCLDYGTIEGEKISKQSLSTQTVNTKTYLIPFSMLQLPIIIRTKQVGDRMYYDGLKGSKKLQRIFIDEKISPAERSKYPVVTNGKGEIIWLPGLKKRSYKDDKAKEFIKLHFNKNTEERSYAK